MPQRHFLTAPQGLCQQVADFFAARTESGTLPPENSLLITPTAGAAREVLGQLNARGIQAPLCAQPMQALLPEGTPLASPVERCLAWAEALRVAPAPLLKTLFWKETPQTFADLLKAGRHFNQLCDQLAEGGHSPARLPLPDRIKGGFEEERWGAVASLHAAYLGQLESWSLQDPNALRLHEIERPSRSLTALTLAGVPDLPVAFEHFAARLEAGGTEVHLLIWNPAESPEADFDAWGRPLPSVWKDRPIPIEAAQIHVAPSARDEARHIARRVQSSPAQLVAADPHQATLTASAILAVGRQPYLPEGEPLIRSEAAKMILEWSDFSQTKDLRRLRRLLELPAFCRSLDPEHPLAQSEALSAIDHLLGKVIVSTLDDAWAASPQLPEETTPPREQAVRGRVRRLLGTVAALLPLSAGELLERAYADEAARPETAQRVLDVCAQLHDSPAARSWLRKGALPPQLLAQAIRAEAMQKPAEPDAVTLNGWLEAPWLPGGDLLLSGLIEGRLPQSIDGDPFLPDSIRPELGLNDNTRRLARDAYLLHSLLASRGTGEIALSFSKYNRDGDPNRPSRLLLRTEADQLPERVKHISRATAKSESRPSRKTNWRWKLPDAPQPVEKISPTQFEGYLACPFRFFLQKVMHYEPAEPAAHEMDAAVFGSLIHKALEDFGREAIRDGRAMLDYHEAHIQNRIQALLQDEALRLFGPNPMPAVRVQLANAATRLHAFARVQAVCFQEGWQILDVERKLSADAEAALPIGPLKLSGMIDRIEQHAETGALRILDYKTFSTKKTPAATHLGPLSHNWLPPAQVELQTGRRVSQKTWKNLQLPLYRKILEHWYPEASRAREPETAYFVLPSDPNETAICPFAELSSELNPQAYDDALTCATAVAEHIAAGVFWPPQPFRGSWDDPCAPLLVNGTPEASVHPETIALLKGGAP